MKTASLSKWLFLGTGIYAALCIPAILLAEQFGWSQRPFHTSQFFAVLACLPASVVFLWKTRGSGFGTLRWLASWAALLCALWLAFVLYVILTFDLPGMD